MKDAILSAAMQLANLSGFKKVTRANIAAKADVAPGLVSYHFGDMKKLRDAMVERAVESKNLKLLAQALADRHPIALKAPDALRRAAAMQLAA
jgi:AcrR family transcriptional regulator